MSKKILVLSAENAPRQTQNGDGLDAATNIISNVIDPVSLQDAATKNYVDSNRVGNLVYSNTSIPAGNTNTSSTGDVAFTSSYTIAANTLIAGSILRIKVFGIYSTAAVDIVKTLTIKIKLGATAFLTFTVSPTVLSLTNQGWCAEVQFNFLTIGASGTVDVQGIAEFNIASMAPLIVNGVNTATQSIDTTASQTITITSAWGTSSASNSIQLRNAAIFIENLSSASAIGQEFVLNLTQDVTTTSGTLASIVDWAYAMGINAKYKVYGTMRFDETSAAAGCCLGATWPAGATGWITFFGETSSATAFEYLSVATSGTPTSTSAPFIAEAQKRLVYFHGEIQTAGTAGVFQMQMLAKTAGQTVKLTELVSELIVRQKA